MISKSPVVTAPPALGGAGLQYRPGADAWLLLIALRAGDGDGLNNAGLSADP